MPTAKAQTVRLRDSNDVVQARQVVRQWAAQMGFTLVDQTKLVTAASELARNTVIYGLGGDLQVEAVTENSRTGLRLIFEDKGPGIADVDLAMKDGYSSGTGLGLGLGGARRLCNEFEIDSKPGRGTRIMIARWK